MPYVPPLPTPAVTIASKALVPLGFTAPWGAYGTTVPGYIVRPDGWVNLQGQVTNSGSVTSPNTIATGLPVPADGQAHTFTIWDQIGSVTHRIDVSATGTLTYYFTSGAGDVFSLDDISYYAGTSTYVGTQGAQGVAGPAGFRNLLHNGDMRINQRGSGSITWSSSGVNRLVDRWSGATSGSQNVMNQWDSGNYPNLAAFRSSLLWQNNTAYTTAAGDYAILSQALEGYDVAQLGWGTTIAKSLMLSFWVRSSITGTMGGSVRCQNDSRSYTFSFPVVSSPNFTQVTVAIPADIATTLVVDNTSRLSVAFSYGSGSNWTSPAAGGWYSQNYLTPPGCTNFSATANSQVWITGVQLEAATSATAFEFRPYEYELTLCQRYYFQTVSTTAAGQLVTDFGIAAQTNVAYIPIRFPVPMRAAFGTANTAFGSSAFGTFYATDRIANYDLVSIAGTSSSSVHQGDLLIGINAFSMTQRSPIALYSKNTTPAYVAYSAEI
jgi:hypothetical protein